MPSAKEREELKARLAKISQSNREKEAEEAPVQSSFQEPIIKMSKEDPQDLEALEAEFEEKRKALVEKQKKAIQSPAPEVQSEAPKEDWIEFAIAEFRDEGKYRVEHIAQLVQLNKSLKDLIEVLRK